MPSNEPAFRVHATCDYNKLPDGGLNVYVADETWRKFFAAMAMQGMLAAGNDASNEELAKYSVQMADALIAELEKKQAGSGEPQPESHGHFKKMMHDLTDKDGKIDTKKAEQLIGDTTNQAPGSGERE